MLAIRTVAVGWFVAALSAALPAQEQQPSPQQGVVQDKASITTDAPATDLFNGRDLTGWTPCNVPDGTFFARDGMIVTTGEPIGLLRTERMFENFIIEFDWRHMVSGGNSGLFIWANAMPAADSAFPRGIEIQILDPGFDRPGKNEWYTTHGDIFPVNGAELTLAGRVSKTGQRSFPREDRTLPSPQWNHYRVVANDGDISLSVNGVEVTIAQNAKPRKGYLMLEAEGSEAHFKNLRITELPSTNPSPDEVAESAPEAAAD